MSSTLQNLESALAGESMAYAKYMYFAKIARQEGQWETLPEKFECPECGCGKEDYELIEA